jgi:hypothetical protein
MLLPVLIGLQLVMTDQAPTLDVRPACRGTDVAEMSQATCLEDERAARDQLIKEWGQFSAQDKAMCTDATENYNPSYVEVLTCLEIARDAKIPSDAGQDQQSGAVGQRP